MTSSDCLEKIKEYEKIKKQIERLNGYVSDCQQVVKKANTYAKETIISKKTVDNKIFTTIDDKINTIPEIQQRITVECNNKIQKYKELYNQLFIQETKQRAREYINRLEQ